MHHAYMQRICVVWILYMYGFAVLADFAGIGLIQAKQHAHKRAFARAVFTEQCVDFSALQLQRNIIVCPYAGKGLGDVQHLDYVIVQAPSLLLAYI